MADRIEGLPETIAGTGGDIQRRKEWEILRFYCTKPTGSNMPVKSLLQLDRDLSPEHFIVYPDLARVIITVDRDNAGEVTLLLVEEELEKQEVTLPPGLTFSDLFNTKNMPSAKVITGYALDLINSAKKNQLIRLMSDLHQKSLDPDSTPEEIYSYINSRTNDPNLINKVASATYPSLAEYLDEYFGDIEANPPEILGIPTHVAKLDKITGGLHGITVLGGMPNRGKSTLAFQFGERAVLYSLPDMRGKVGFLMFSFEMPRKHFLSMLVARYGKMGMTSLRRDKRDKDLLDSISNARPLVEKVAPYIKIIGSDQGRLSLEDVLFQAQIFKNTTGVAKLYLVIDHLQICPTVSTFRSTDPRVRINNVIETLTSYYSILAADNPHSICLLIISQLNRGGYGTTAMSAFRESQAIEASADLMLMLTPKKVVEKRKAGMKEDFDKWIDEDYLTRDMEEGEEMILHIIKNRYGPKGKVGLKFTGDSLYFEEMTEKIGRSLPEGKVSLNPD